MTQFTGYDETALWFGGKRPNPGAAVRLFCFPYAGMGISAYRGWALDGVDVCAVQLPGRESRQHEAPFRRMAPLADAVFAAIVPYLDVPFALMGHSLGATLAFEVARRLTGAVAPARLFVSGRRAPHLAEPQGGISRLTDPQFVEAVQRKYAGIPDAILAAPDLLDLLLPRLRADFELLESYQYSPGGPLACPISVFGGRQDRTVTPAELHAWDQHSSAPTVVRMVDGPHLFLQPQRAVLLAAIQEDLALGCAAPGSAA